MPPPLTRFVKFDMNSSGAVKKMMKDMILQLMDQANEEASQRGWCTTELGTNKQTRDEQKAKKTTGLTVDIFN